MTASSRRIGNNMMHFPFCSRANAVSTSCSTQSLATECSERTRSNLSYTRMDSSVAGRERMAEDGRRRRAVVEHGSFLQRDPQHCLDSERRSRSPAVPLNSIRGRVHGQSEPPHWGTCFFRPKKAAATTTTTSVVGKGSTFHGVIRGRAERLARISRQFCRRDLR